jgi:hypothetical protein
MGAEESGDELELDEPKVAGEGENASNPLAKVKNTDFRWQHLDLDGAEIMISSSMVRSWPTPSWMPKCRSIRNTTRRYGSGLTLT